MQDNSFITVKLSDGRTEQWSQEQYDSAKDGLYAKYPDAEVFRASVYDPSLEAGHDDMFGVKLSDGRFEQWNADQMRQGYEGLMSIYPDAQVIRMTDMSAEYWRPKAEEARNKLKDLEKQNRDFLLNYESEHGKDTLSTFQAQTIDKERHDQYLNQLAEYRKQYYNNPLVKRYYEGEAERAAGLRDEFKTNANEAGDRAERKDWQRAAKLQDDIRKMYEAPSEYAEDLDGENGFIQYLKNYWKGSRDTFSDKDFYTFGLSGIARGFDLRGIAEKVQNATSERDVDQILTPSEKAQLMSFYSLAEAQRERADDVAGAYGSGQTAAESVKFMAEFLLSQGIANVAGKAMAGAENAVVSWIGRQLMSNQALARAVQKGVATIPEASKAVSLTEKLVVKPIVQGLWHTGTQLSTLESIADGLMKTDRNGDLLSVGKVIGTEVLDQIVENWSESLGSAVEGVMPKEWFAGKTSFGRFMRWMNQTKPAEILGSAGFNGLLGEIGEEWAGNAVRLGLGLMSGEEFKDFASWEQQLEMAASFAPMTLFGMGTATAAAMRYSGRYKDLQGKVQNIIERQGHNAKRSDDEIKKEIENLFNTRFDTPEDIGKKLAPYLKDISVKAEKQGATKQDEEDYKTMLDFARELGLDAIYKEQDRLEQEGKRNQVRDNIYNTVGRFWQESEETPEAQRNVRIVTDADGNSIYVTASDDKGVTGVSVIDGKPKFIDNDQIQEDNTLPMQEYLQQQSELRDKDAEQSRMQQEALEQVSAVRQNTPVGSTIPVGTDSEPIDATVAEVLGDGVRVVWEADGQPQEQVLSWYDVAAKKNTPIVVKSDEELKQDAAKALDEARKRTETFNKVPAGTKMVVNLEDVGPVELKFQKAVEDDGQVLVYGMDENGDSQPYAEESIANLEEMLAAPVAEQMEENPFKTGEAVTYQDAEGNTLRGVVVEADNGGGYTSVKLSNGTPATVRTEQLSIDNNVERDFEGKPLPMRENTVTGQMEVNSTDLWNTNPEGWLEWNDSNPNSTVSSEEKLSFALSALNDRIATNNASIHDYDLRGGHEAERDKLDAENKGLIERRDKLQFLLDFRVATAAKRAAAANMQEEAQAPAAAPTTTPQRYTQASARTTYEDIYNDEAFRSDEEAYGFIQGKVAKAKSAVGKAQEALNKVQQQNRAGKYETTTDFAHARDAAEQTLAAAQQELDYWNDVSGLADADIARAKKAERLRDNEMYEPKTLIELVADAFIGFRNGLNKESFKKETGYSDADMKPFFQLWARKGKGLTVDGLAHTIAENDTYGLVPTDDNGMKDVAAVKDAILEVFQQAKSPSDLYDYTYNANLARQQAEAEYVAQQQATAEEAAAEAEQTVTEGEPVNVQPQMEAEEIAPVGKNRFGNIFEQFRGKVKDAFEFLIKRQEGYLRGVFHREDLGDIDLAWGAAPTRYSGYGLSHIIKKHIETLGDFESLEDAERIIADVIENGTAEQALNDPDLIYIQKGDYRVVVANNEEGNWVLSAFDFVNSAKQKEKNKEKKEDTAAIGTPGQSDVEAGAVTSNLPSSEDKGTENSENASMAEEIFADTQSQMPEELQNRVTVRESSTGDEAYQNFLQSYDIDGKPSGITRIEFFDAGIDENPTRFLIDGSDVDALQAEQERWESLAEEYHRTHPDVPVSFFDEAGIGFSNFKDAYDFLRWVQQQQSSEESGQLTEAQKNAIGFVEGKTPEQVEAEQKEAKRQKKLLDRVDKWKNFLGDTFEVLTSMEQIEALDENTRNQVKAEMDKGNTVYAWYNPVTDKVQVYIPNITDAAMLDRKILHEVVSHRGLRGLFETSEDFGRFCDNIWDKVMDEEQRAAFLAYVGGEDTLANRRAAADEFLAHAAEHNTSIVKAMDENLWGRIVDALKNLINDMMGEDFFAEEHSWLDDLLEKAAANYIQERRAAEAQQALEAQAAEEKRQDVIEGLLGGESKAMETARAQENPQVPISRTQEKYEDFGEKIGMARKDIATSTGKKGKGDGRPAWMKKYQTLNVERVSDPVLEEARRRGLRTNGFVPTAEDITQGTDFSKPFIAFYEEKSKSRFGMPRRRYITGEDRQPIIFTSQEQYEATLPVFEAKDQGYRVMEKDGGYIIYRRASNNKAVEYAKFNTKEEAVAYLASPEGCTDMLNRKRENYELPALERLTRNNMPDYRQGKNITPDDILKTFGFRGGEFGNWLNAEERQQFLNLAYDALMDLSQMLGISPRALSLNGELSIAFGARGKAGSGAAAHYESTRAVINLTKMNGAGSLAHEWAHALDNYFGLMDAKRERIRDDEHGEENKKYLSEGQSYKRGARKEVIDAFREVMQALQKKTVTRKIETDKAQAEAKKKQDTFDYYVKGDRESFERGITRYQYNRKTKQREKVKIVPTAEQLTEFDRLVALLPGDPTFKWQYELSKNGFRASGEVAEKLYALVKDVSPNRAGTYGPLHNTFYGTPRLQTALTRLKEAQEGKTETVVVDTDFMEESKWFDRGRAGDYWTKDLEMFARAFETYLSGKMREQEQSSDYLTYMKGPLYKAMWDHNPYPAGEELQTATAAFDNLFKTIQERVDETTGNTVLFSRSSITTDDGTVVNFESRGGLPDGAEHESIVERTYRKTGAFSFMGKNRIETAGDVAFIFRELETAATENSFVVYVKDGIPTILHTGIGNAHSTFIDEAAFVAGLNDFAPDEVYMVHNHPSGNVVASMGDIREIELLQKAAGEIPVYGVIIDTMSGEYGQFTSDEATLIASRNKSDEGDTPLEVHTFDKLIFSEDYRSASKQRPIADAEGVASYLSAHRLGNGSKVGALLVDRYNRVVGNLVLNESIVTKENAGQLAKDVVNVAIHNATENVVLFGDFDYDAGAMSRFSQEVNTASAKSVKLMDVVRVEGKRTLSAQEGTLTDDKARRRDHIRFSRANENQRIFISNAEAAVDAIPMAKATPQQWLKMIESKGGLKAGEDKWIGLSDWLKEQDVKTLTKQEVLDYIAQNKIQIEETRYGGSLRDEIQDNIGRGKSLADLQAEIDELKESAARYDAIGENPTDEEMDQYLRDAMVEEYGDDFDMGYVIMDGYIEYNIDPYAEDEYRENYVGPGRPIDNTRLEYTTEGLDNKREIALTVPTIEPWNQSDTVHFGDAGEGRAIAWIRFGDAEQDGKRVLFIDEIQSKRHQEGREQGYQTISKAERDRLNRELYLEYKEALDAWNMVARRLMDKYRVSTSDIIAAFRQGRRRVRLADVPETEREEFRKVDQPIVEYLEKDAAIRKAADSSIPAAPFEKNWHELAMKRMLRLAAEEGYNYVAWTTGEQQAERYDIGGVLKEIDVTKYKDGGWKLYFDYRDGRNEDALFDKDGIAYGGSQFDGKHMSEAVGKELASKIMNHQPIGKLLNAPKVEDYFSIGGDGLRIGGEGMKGFYDQMLPRFMDKYGKKWGVKTEDMEFPNLENGITAHAIPVTEEMKESVMEGQLMFSRAAQAVEQADEGGIQAVVGSDNAKEFVADIYRAMPAEMRRTVVDKAMGGDLNIHKALVDDLSRIAYEGYENDEAGILRAAGKILSYYAGENLDEATVRYILWRNGQPNDLLTDAQAAALKKRWGVGEALRFSREMKEDVDAADNAAEATVDEAAKALSDGKRDLKDMLTATRAMRLQKEYDKKTIEAVTNLAKQLLKDQSVSEMSRRDIARLLGLVRTSAGRSPRIVKRNADTIVEIVIDNLLKKEKAAYEAMTKKSGTKTNATGVEVQGELDIQGQKTLKAYKEGLKLKVGNVDDSDNENTLYGMKAKVQSRLNSKDDAVRAEAEAEDAGLTMAIEYQEGIAELLGEEKGLEAALDDLKAALAEGEITKKAYDEAVESTNDAIRANHIDQVEAYRDFATKMRAMLSQSREDRAAFVQAEKDRVNEIHHLANSDMQGKSASRDKRPTFADKLANNPIARFAMAPLATFDQMLRLFGEKSINGEGYLWNRFMSKWQKATENEYTGQRDAKEKLDKKVSEVFGKKMIWSDLYDIELKMPKVTARWWDDGEMKDHELTQGQLLYIYMVNKMADGRMKLRRMGIEQEHVDAIVRQMDERFLTLADWLQEEFLVDLRNKYNAVHERLFGASMAAIDDYFPLVINKRDLERNEDVGLDTDFDSLPSTTTGSIIKRKRNNKALDLMNADAFSVVIDHIDQMEKWAAFAEFNKDVNALLSYKRFRNQVQNMASVYGSGTKLWDNFKSVAKIAAGSYKPKRSNLDKDLVNIAKGVTAAKISFRVYTALKQTLSMPAFLADASMPNLAKSLATAGKSWNWAMENLPIFEKRWKSRIAGDTRLMQTDLDWNFYRKKLYDKASKLGMSPNAFVDAVTVAVGAKAIYDTKYAQFKSEGFSDEDADRKAKTAATVLVNETQQSSEGAFVSPVQLDRTVLATMITVFRNSSMGFQRQVHDSLRNLGKHLKPGYKEQSLEYTKKQLMRDGLTEEQAEQAANKRYNKSFVRDATRLAVFGFLVEFSWNLGSYIVYLLFGDDDDKKKEMLADAARHAMFGGLIEGLAGGNVVSEGLNTVAQGESLWNYDPQLLPLFADIKSAYSKMSSDPVAGWNDVVNLAVQAGVGVNPQTLTDAVVAVADACNGDLETSKEAMLLIMRVLQVPQSQVDELYIDELGTTARGAQKMSYSQMAQRYADYKIAREAPLTGWAYSEADRKKREKSKKTTFKKKVNERKK